ncbi:unnamed protein product [Lactuca virosa]|uniref:Non-haem dioxygenase N-terminal domain-containing protein n=1 Tax=Lactuca virosa TaxID=75947 RepID=A0AAU9PDG4_9ASTR|nr:unnamed protein product [Lactuca virosa]
MVCARDWPKPVVRVQSLSKSGKPVIPDRYIKPPPDQPVFNSSSSDDINIPVIDLDGLTNDDLTLWESTFNEISATCLERGSFQVINHGLKTELVDGVRDIWREFFHELMDVKQQYANSPQTYEGYGSRLGLEKGAILDWSNYYFHHYLPPPLKDHN